MVRVRDANDPVCMEKCHSNDPDHLPDISLRERLLLSMEANETSLMRINIGLMRASCNKWAVAFCFGEQLQKNYIGLPIK